jgi:hypothetical protein
MKIENIASKHPDYHELVEHYANGKMLMKGSIEMRNKKAITLPRNQYETEYNYNQRVERTMLLNVYKDTYDKLSKKPFQEPAKWSGDIPEHLSFIKDNIDGAGSTQEAFYEQLVGQHLQFGKHMFMVNMPNLKDKTGRKINPVDQKKLKLHPFVSLVAPDGLINWYYGKNNKLQMIKIEFTSEELDSDGEVVKVDKIQYITADVVEIYKKGTSESAEDYELEIEYANELNEVNLIVGNNIYDLPALENLGELNMLHYQKVSDKDNNIHTANTPFLHFGGFGKDDVKAVVAVKEAYINSNTNAFIKWVEVSGEGISLAIDDIVKLEARMKAAGSDMTRGMGVAKTATESNSDKKDEMSTLQSIVTDVEQSAVKMINMMCRWQNKEEPELSLELFKDFNVEDRALEELKLLQKDLESGTISQETYLRELKSSKVLKNKDFDVEGELAKTAIIPFNPEAENEEENEEEI